MTFIKYPRTQHIQGSRLQHGDHDLEAVSWKELQGKHLVVEEKMDGANVGISFEDERLMIQSRGHFLRGGPRERHFDRLKQWAASFEAEFYVALGNRYVMFGEWLYAKHTCFYDELPHYFMEFDLYDKDEKKFFSTIERQRFYQATGLANVITPVLVLSSGVFSSLDELRQHIGHSRFKSLSWKERLSDAARRAGVDPTVALAHTDPSDEMEGLYVKCESDQHVLGRYKFVRSSFTNSIMDQDQHWLERPIIANALSTSSKMFSW